MNKKSEKPETALGRANAAFSASDQRDKLIRSEIEKERAATDAKTARLKALRLAKEQADRDELAANPPPPKAKSKAKSKAKPKVKPAL